MLAENLLEAAKISLIFQGRVDIILGFRFGGVTEQVQTTVFVRNFKGGTSCLKN
jgi:hypothetical protein